VQLHDFGLRRQKYKKLLIKNDLGIYEKQYNIINPEYYFLFICLFLLLCLRQQRHISIVFLLFLHCNVIGLYHTSMTLEQHFHK